MDAVADWRFCSFFDKGTDDGDKIAKGEWRARCVRHWYEKDKTLPVSTIKIPPLDESNLQQYPPGYMYMALMKHNKCLIN